MYSHCPLREQAHINTTTATVLFFLSRGCRSEFSGPHFSAVQMRTFKNTYHFSLNGPSPIRHESMGVFSVCICISKDILLSTFLWGRECGECTKHYIWEALTLPLLYYLTLHLQIHGTFFQPGQWQQYSVQSAASSLAVTQAGPSGNKLIKPKAYLDL